MEALSYSKIFTFVNSNCESKNHPILKSLCGISSENLYSDTNELWKNNYVSDGKAIKFLPRERLITEEEISEIEVITREVLKSGEFTTGKYVPLLQNELGKFYENKNIICCNSGTTAISVALLALGVKRGDEVIIPANSFAATENAILSIGATPVLSDIDINTGNLDPRKLIFSLSERTKVIMPVHLYGKLAPMEEISQFAKEHDLLVVEDACQAFGLDDVGRFSDAAAFSFNPYKNLGFCGKSGAILCKDNVLAKKIEEILYHGFEPGMKNIKSHPWGYNAQIDNLQAAIGLIKLKFFLKSNVKRLLLAKRYCTELSSLNKFGVTVPKFSSDNSWHLYPIYFSSKDMRDEVKRILLNDFNVETDIYYPVLTHKQPPIKGHIRISIDGVASTEYLNDRILHLPMYPNMPLQDQLKVVDCLFISISRIVNNQLSVENQELYK